MNSFLPIFSSSFFDHVCGLQVKILYAGWRRDGTWPDSATAVDDDNFFGTIQPHEKSELITDNVTQLTMSDTSSLVGRNPR
jgi:hypothetical protein